jgi:hypothetical protein
MLSSEDDFCQGIDVFRRSNHQRILPCLPLYLLSVPPRGPPVAERAYCDRMGDFAVLGRLLMELRERLLHQGADSLKVVEPATYRGFHLVGRLIEAVAARSQVVAPPKPLL